MARTAIALVVSAVVEIGLHTVRLPRLSRLLGVPLDTVGPREPDIAAPVIVPRRARRRLAAARRALKYWPFGDSCLRMALVGGFLVRDLDPVLRIGVAKHDGVVKAHAWIEIGGLSIDPGAADFAPVESARS
ncbi:lasso peptide biosynthesis B2 protein [Nocardioides flavus (ex Wang et al. 2016)]|uniref:lasso peptide biosynthesis B2 protein n=1 Tax=Nocardioides flavus (ex Wang et al. 2016) TaxID=2058780 RepID=UPI00174B028A|nr:lasso peptide biosynthesis B2 protein [Nocardioides flavus (ex Wang et al. 2016)]